MQHDAVRSSQSPKRQGHLLPICAQDGTGDGYGLRIRNLVVAYGFGTGFIHRLVEGYHSSCRIQQRDILHNRCQNAGSDGSLFGLFALGAATIDGRHRIHILCLVHCGLVGVGCSIAHCGKENAIPIYLVARNTTVRVRSCIPGEIHPHLVLVESCREVFGCGRRSSVNNRVHLDVVQNLGRVQADIVVVSRASGELELVCAILHGLVQQHLTAGLIADGDGSAAIGEEFDHILAGGLEAQGKGDGTHAVALALEGPVPVQGVGGVALIGLREVNLLDVGSGGIEGTPTLADILKVLVQDVAFLQLGTGALNSAHVSEVSIAVVAAAQALQVEGCGGIGTCGHGENYSHAEIFGVFERRVEVAVDQGRFVHVVRNFRPVGQIHFDHGLLAVSNLRPDGNLILLAGSQGDGLGDFAVRGAINREITLAEVGVLNGDALSILSPAGPAVEGVADEGGVLHGAAVTPVGHFDRRSILIALVEDIGGVRLSVDGHLAILNLQRLLVGFTGVRQAVELDFGLTAPAVRQVPSTRAALAVPMVDLIGIVRIGRALLGLIEPRNEEQAISVSDQLVVLIDLLVAGSTDTASEDCLIVAQLEQLMVHQVAVGKLSGKEVPDRAVIVVAMLPAHKSAAAVVGGTAAPQQIVVGVNILFLVVDKAVDGAAYTGPVHPAAVLIQHCSIFVEDCPAMLFEILADPIGGKAVVHKSIQICQSHIRNLFTQLVKFLVHQAIGDEVLTLDIAAVIQPAAPGVVIRGGIPGIPGFGLGEHIGNVDVAAHIGVIVLGVFCQGLEVLGAAGAHIYIRRLGVAGVVTLAVVALDDQHLTEAVRGQIDLLKIVTNTQEGLLCTRGKVHSDVDKAVLKAIRAGHGVAHCVESQGAVLPVYNLIIVPVLGEHHCTGEFLHGGRDRVALTFVTKAPAAIDKLSTPRTGVGFALCGGKTLECKLLEVLDQGVHHTSREAVGGEDGNISIFVGTATHGSAQIIVGVRHIIHSALVQGLPGHGSVQLGAVLGALHRDHTVLREAQAINAGVRLVDVVDLHLQAGA